MAAPLILVDEQNRALGTATREQAHTSPGKLHRAFSVYVFRSGGTEMLIQKRHPHKLWGGIWANSCCSHPREGEEIAEVAHRRLKEELGFVCTLLPSGSFVYRAEDPAGKGAEYEHVTIFRGDVPTNVSVQPDPTEIAEWKWIAIDQLVKDMKTHSDFYAPWFHIGLEKLRISELTSKRVNV